MQNNLIRLQGWTHTTLRCLVLGSLVFFTGFSLFSQELVQGNDYVAPLLKTTWGMHGEYAKYSKGKRLGCWSVAIAQILNFHKSAPVGTMTNNHEKDTVVFRPINWSLVVPSLEEHVSEAEKDETARFCYYAAVLMGKNFDDDTYAGNSDVRRKNLSDHCPVITRRAKPKSGNTESVRKMVFNELRAHRPVLLFSGGVHALVIDGLDTRNGKWLVHLNFGWNGRSDGWYDFFSPLKPLDTSDSPEQGWVMSLELNPAVKAASKR